MTVSDATTITATILKQILALKHELASIRNRLSTCNPLLLLSSSDSSSPASLEQLEHEQEQRGDDDDEEEWRSSALRLSIQSKCDHIEAELKQQFHHYLCSIHEVKWLLSHHVVRMMMVMTNDDNININDNNSKSGHSGERDDDQIFEMIGTLCQEYAMTDVLLDQMARQLGHRIIHVTRLILSSSSSSTSTRIDDADEPMIQFLRQHHQTLLDRHVQNTCNRILDNVRSMFSHDGDNERGLYRETRDDDDYLNVHHGSLFPISDNCPISVTAKRVVSYVDELMSEAIALSSSSDESLFVNQSNQYLHCIKDVCRLYQALAFSRLNKSRGGKWQDTELGRTLSNDCMFLSQTLVKYSVSCRLTPTCFLETIRELRALAQRVSASQHNSSTGTPTTNQGTRKFTAKPL